MLHLKSPLTLILDSVDDHVKPPTHHLQHVGHTLPVCFLNVCTAIDHPLVALKENMRRVVEISELRCHRLCGAMIARWTSSYAQEK